MLCETTQLPSQALPCKPNRSLGCPLRALSLVIACPICERVIATIPRECLDWLIPLSESHLRSILKSKEPLERLAIGATDAEKEMAVAIVVMLQRVRLAIHGVFPPKDEKQGRLPGLVRDAHAPLRWSAIVSNGTLCPR